MLKDDSNGTVNKDADDKKRRRKAADIIYYVVMALLAGVFLFAAYHVYSIKHNYDVAVNEYKDLDKSVKISDESTAAKSADGSGTDAAEESTNVYFPSVDIDFDTLKAKNGDLIGWIYIPALDISYPVMQGKDNEHYLHYTYDGTKNSSGSIFMDYQSSRNMTDMNTFIYGHNMKNGSMFGKLKKFNQDKTLCDSDPYIYYFRENRSYRYRIFAYYITKVGSKTYNNMGTSEEYDAYMKYVGSVNQYKTNVENKDRAQILTLSTCSGLHTDNRMIVQGILAGKIKN